MASTLDREIQGLSFDVWYAAEVHETP